MMMIQHYFRTKFPLIHKILFISSLDPVVLKLNRLGLVLITLFFIAYYFILIVVLFFVSAFDTSDVNTENAKKVNPSTRKLDSTPEDVDAYVIPFLLAFFLMCYWVNKIVLALLFWSIIFLMIFLVF